MKSKYQSPLFDRNYGIPCLFQDVLAFMVLFIFIIAAFCVGFHNLYWYFYSYPPEGETVLGRRRHSSFTRYRKHYLTR